MYTQTRQQQILDRHHKEQRAQPPYLSGHYIERVGKHGFHVTFIYESFPPNSIGYNSGMSKMTERTFTGKEWK